MKKDITYYDLIRIVHDKVPSHISFLLMLKLDFTYNNIFYILSYFLRFNSILILCGNFQLTLEEVKENKSISNYLRYFTAKFLMESFNITNFTYIIISLVIFVLFCFRIFLYFLTIYRLKKKQNLEKISLNKYQVFMDHIVFLLYPFLLEFLVEILYSFIFPDTFIFKKDQSNFINILILVLNILLIIGYNINNYYYLLLINRPFSDREVPVKYRYSHKKFWVIFFMQNIALVQNVDSFLQSDKQLSIFAYCYFCLFALIFFIFFLTSLDTFNYDILTNHFVSIMSGFCFFSILVEASSRILGYHINSDLSFITFNLLKVVTSCYFEYLNNNINNNKLFNLAKTELFKVNKQEITNKSIYDIFLYVFDILKNVKNNTDNISSVSLLNTIFEHQNKCNINNCKCKLLQILPHGEQYDHNFTLNLIERTGFLIESSFVQLHYSENYDLTLILSEHFFLFKENPIMAYSLIQTLLFFNSDNLSLDQFLILYETCQKYIESSLDYNFLRKRILKNKSKEKHEGELLEKISHDILKEKKFRDIFLIYEKIWSIQSMMDDYCQIVIDTMKKKNLVEESSKIKKNEESQEILFIDFIYLDSKRIEEIIKSLKTETNLNKKIFEEISQLKTSKLPMEFYYKIFIFCETFWEGKIDEKILPTFYSFTNDHNLYSTTINPNIFILLRQRYIDLNNQGLSQYYSIFKYCKGMTINYFSEPLSQMLGYLQSDLIDNNIDILLPNDISKPHNNLVLHYLITQQNRVYKTIKNRMFNKKGLSIDSTMNGASLPGLGKNLLMIVNVKIHENDSDFYMYFNQNLDLISISNNFSTYFSLDLDLINKCNVNMLTIFGINSEFIKKKLAGVMPIIKEYKYNLDIMTEEIFTKKLFKQINKFNSIKFKLLEEIENHNLEENENNFNTKMLKAQKSLERIYNNQFNDKIQAPILLFKKSKSSVINNFNKYINNNDKIDYNDKSYKKLIESFLMIQNYNLQTNKNTNGNGNGNNNVNSIYYYSIRLSILYDVPFVSIKITEKSDGSLIDQSLENNAFMNNRIAKVNSMIMNENYKNNISYAGSTKEQNTRTHTNNTRNRTATATSAAFKIINFQNKIKLSKNFFEKYIKEIVIIFICCVLLVYVIILVYQLQVIKICYNIFLAFYYNYIQRDRLVNLHSSIFSEFYYFSNLVNYTEYMTLSEYHEYIVDSAQKYSSSFHTFYQNYINYRFSLGKDLSSLYENLDISKISVNWDEIDTQSNYMNEVENIAHSATISPLNDHVEDILVDIYNFFNSRFKNLTGEDKRLKSHYASILYYFSANMQKSYILFFRKIQNEINEAQENYSSSSMYICTLVEILGFLINLIMLSGCMYYLIRTNKTIYKNISNLFIDFTQEGEYNFKNSQDNYIIVEKLMQLKFLINNFSIKAIDKFNKKISYGSIEMMEERGEKSIVSIETKPSFNKNKKEHEKNKKKSNNDTSKNNITNTSTLNTKTQNQLLNTNSVNLISKLNQNLNVVDKSNNSTSTKNSIIQDTSVQNINTNTIKKKDEEEVDLLTADKINEKLKIIDINSIKLFLRIIFIVVLILLVYAFSKIIVTMNYLKKTKQMFLDYSIVTFEYSMIINYFDNLNLILVNKDLGRTDVLDGMQTDVEAQFKKSEEVKMKSIAQYPNVYEMFSALNNADDIENLKKVLCEDDKYCLNIFDSKYNIVKKGIDVGLKTVAQVIYNVYKDYLQLKDSITEIENLGEYFITDDYKQIDMSLNFLLTLVEDRCANAFIIDCDNLIKSFNLIIIVFNIFIIAFLAIVSIFLTIFIIDKISNLSILIEKSSVRLCTTICFIKEKNTGMKIKTSSII